MPLLVLILNLAAADILFEGYSKVLVDGKQSGFTVQRYEFDKSKKQFSGTFFTRLNAEGGNTTESLQAKCKDNFKPISFFYSLKSDSETKTIDGKVSGKKLVFKIIQKQKTKTLSLTLPPGVFLSSFLSYLMLQNGYQVGKKFRYQSIAEEDGLIVDGKAFIEKEDRQNEIPVYHVLNKYKKIDFLNIVTDHGETLSTSIPGAKIETHLVKTRAEATKGISYSRATLVSLFGEEPEGNKNILFKAAESP